MEHTFVAVDSPAARPWRTATLVTGAVALLELVAILVLAAVLLGRPVAERMQEAAEAKALAPLPEARKPAAKPAPDVPKLARDETSVLVLNGNGAAGAAAGASAIVHGKGYLVGGVGNAERSDYTRSIVMYRKGYKPEAERLARDVGVKVVGPLDGMKPAELMGAHVVYVVGD